MDPINQQRKIIHIDMDAFFASVEQRENPHLKGLPVIVGGNPHGRGVVSACSYEARTYGIHSAMSCAKARRLCPKAIFIRPHMERYKEVSQTIMAIFHETSSLVEPLSLDEAFLDVTINKKKNPSATLLAQELRSQIFRKTGLTASAGVSCNKFLAKIASDINKPDGITVITPEEVLPFIGKLPVRKFYGVGKVTERKMHALGIKTGGDLRRFQRSELLHYFGKSGIFFHDIVRGIDNRPIIAERSRKSIGSETTLSKDVT
ncbi:MAG: DNA polymerase IV, partial [Desulfobulbaceae bacterium]|nr:DNA polymerase IV [Desulfobulbaceae bacterium]